jgi:N-methylhydantoinase B
MKLDPATLEVLRNRLVTIAYEMGTVLKRTGYSPNIREREDCSCVLADPAGQIIAQAEHIPGHLGMLAVAMPALLQRLPPEVWEPGDVVIFNDPYVGGSHLPDIRLVVPIIVDGRLLGFAANLAHHADVGGMAPGSMPSTATEIFQEGVFIPFVRLYRRGVQNEDLLRLFLQNVRTPEEREGDLRAQLAAAQLGERRIREVVDKLGVDAWFAYGAEILNSSERLMRAKIARLLPAGRYEAAMRIDDDGVDPTPITIKAAVTVEGDAIQVDFTGSDPQRRSAVNCIWGFTVSATYFVVKAVVDPAIPANSGCYRPITVEAPEGSVVRVRPPGACAAGNETWQRIAEVLIAAFAKADPRLVKAPSHGCMNNVVFGGMDPRSGRLYTYYETIGGGEGGRAGLDGMDGVHVLGTNTMNTPVEVIESSFPLRVEAYELIPDSGGVGAFRGGLGIKRVYRVLDHQTTLVINSDWIRWKPEGLLGGERGALTRFVLDEGTDHERVPQTCKFIVQLDAGSTLSVYTGGGNGYLPPRDRDPEAILQDLRNDKISPEAARAHYGLAEASLGS